MFILDILPIKGSAQKEYLSYFSQKEISVGSTITVPLRKKSIQGIVVEVRKAEDDKANLKELPYALKKIENVKEKKFLRKEFIEAAKKIAYENASFTGATLSVLLPQRILDNADEILTVEDNTETKEHKPSNKKTETYLIQSEDEDRFADYKSLIRESFAKQHSVFFCVPTVEDAKRAGSILEKGIEDYTFILDGSLTKKDTIFTWNEALNTKHPILIIGTGMFLSIPRRDIKTILVEKESSRSYKTIQRPYIDLRSFIENYGKSIGAKVVLGDILLRTETLARLENMECAEYSTLKWRSLTTAKESVIDMKAESKKSGFKTLSEEAIKIIEEAREDNGHCFIYSARRGLSPTVVCKDCETIVTCDRCSAPVVLHGGASAVSNFFLCHKCGDKRSAAEKCKKCDSWNLVTLGVGVENVEKEVRQNFPKANILRIDHDTVKNNKQAKSIIKHFYDEPGSILIGTEMALVYLSDKIENIIVASIDSLLGLPDFRGNEKIMSILLRARQLASKNFLIQTRKPEEDILSFATKGNIADFFRFEIEERKSFGYPPFTVLIKITYQGKKEEVLEEMKKLKEFLNPYKVQIFPAFIETVRGKFIMHALIKADKNEWPDDELIKKLKSLPPYFVVKIDPESLL